MTQQHYGMFLSSLEWQVYACGTYRNLIAEDGAKATFKFFLDRLEKHVKRVACVSVLERRKFSGLDLSSTPLHWHFVLAAPPQYREILLQLVQELWGELYGNCKSEAYLPDLPGMYYIAKTASEASFEWDPHNLDRMYLKMKADLFREQQANDFVPDHVRDRTRAETLVVRRAATKLSSVHEKGRHCRSLPSSAAREEREGGHHGRDW